MACLRASFKILAIVSGVSFLCFTGGYNTSVAAAEGVSPFESVDMTKMNYPDGTNLQHKYESGGGVRLQAAEMGRMSAAAASAGAASLIQLPAGLTLHGGGEAARVMFDPEGRQAMEAEPGEGAGKVFINYRVDYQGIPLAKGNDVLAIVSEDGELETVRKRNLPTQVDTTNPTVDAETAGQVGMQHAQSAASGGTLTMTAPTLEIWVAPGSQTGRLAWMYMVSSSSDTDPLGRQYWVAATGDPTILHWESTVYHTHQGKVTGKVWLTSPLKPKGDRGLRDLKVTRTGGGGGSKITGPTGAYSLPGTGSVTMKASLSGGSFSKIENLSGAVLARNKPGTHSAPINLDFNASPVQELAQTTAFYWTNVAYQFHKSILTPLPTTAYKKLTTRVNRPGQCNAFWNGSSINFYNESTQCPNMAYRSVVLHEYGHGADHWRGGILDGGYSEGYGDAVSILVTRSPCLGLDFKKDGKCLRNATDVVKWPPSNPQVHFVGKIYAGFTWALVQELKKTLSDNQAYKIATQLTLAAAAGNPKNIPDAIKLTFLADDNDGNLGNGTPHCKQIKAAADSRTIPLPVGLKCVGPGPGPGKACSAIGSNGQFSFSPPKKVSSNSNIVTATINLKEEMEVHINANSSVRTTNQSMYFRTGFYTGASPNTMWTNSYRPVHIPQANQWVNFGSTFAIKLKPGSHTFYWKIWVSGGQLEFSSGSMSVEAFCIPGKMVTGAALGTMTFRDANGQEVIRMEAAPEVDVSDVQFTSFQDESGHEVMRAGD